MERLIMGISGASGVRYAQRFLEAVREYNTIEIHLVITANARAIIRHELGDSADLPSLVARVYQPDDMMAPIASGSFPTDGMVIIPCSMKTLAGIASGYADNLLLRAADVTMKERRPLILVPREAPLGPVHLENMLKLSNWGASIFPACPGFYHLPNSLEDLVDQFVYRLMDIMGLQTPLKRWGTPEKPGAE